ncbi:MAG TPA: hypothetical protein VMT35_18350 [Ignavibacteriaceae bacterium]|nr:hypothetical protein [Ignavibacteriaceae bacterium]
MKLFGIIDYSAGEIIGYIFIIYGLALVYTSMGKDKKLLLFIGSSLFLAGVFLFIINNFQLTGSSNPILTSIILIPGISFFILFIDDFSNKLFLILSAGFTAVGLLIIISTGSPTFSSFFSSILYIAVRYWPVVLIVIGIALIIKRDEAA